MPHASPTRAAAASAFSMLCVPIIGRLDIDLPSGVVRMNVVPDELHCTPVAR
jgi:hypothetical protein